MNDRGLLVLPIVCLALLSGCETTSSMRLAEKSMLFEISKSEREQAISLVQDSGDFQKLAAEQQIYLVDVEVFRDKDAELERGEASRQVLVTHYAAAEDLAILSRVDLESNFVIDVEIVPNLPVRLSQEEYEIAVRLALDDPRVQAALRGIEVEIEAQLSRTSDERDPQFRHRVVHFLFKTPSGYLESPIVIVDLTAREVIVE